MLEDYDFEAEFRDQCAMRAMAALIELDRDIVGDPEQIWLPIEDKVARKAYDYADAMVKERQRRAGAAEKAGE